MTPREFKIDGKGIFIAWSWFLSHWKQTIQVLGWILILGHICMTWMTQRLQDKKLDELQKIVVCLSQSKCGK